MAGDSALATRLHQQGAAGLGDVYAAYADRLYGYAITITGDRELAGDAVHDTFLVALDRIGQLRDPDKLRPWLFAIARNECLRRLRDRNRFASVPDSAEVLDAMGDEPDLTEGISRDEATDLVQSAMTGLSPTDRDVLTLAIAADLDAAAVGAVLGVDSKGVHARLSRAREALGASVTALVLARTRGRDCADLAGILSEYPRFDPLLRKRISRHVKQCDTCDRRGRAAALASAPALAAPVVAVSAPAGLSEGLFGSHGSAWSATEVAAAGARSGPFGPDGFPVPLAVSPAPAVTAQVGSPPPPGLPRDSGSRRRLAAVAAGVGALVLGLLAWTAVANRDSPLAATPAPSSTPQVEELLPTPTAEALTPAPSPSGPETGAPAANGTDKQEPEGDGNQSPTQQAKVDPTAPATPASKAEPDPISVEQGSTEPGPGAKNGSGSTNGNAKNSNGDRGGQQPAPDKKPRPGGSTPPKATPTPPLPAPPTAPQIVSFSIADLDRVDGSFTRCDAFSILVSATVTGPASSAVADYGTGSLQLTAVGNQWNGGATLPAGEYTVTLRVTGPGGTTEQAAPALLHVCPG